jgi:Tol biopolymer transport system component
METWDDATIAVLSLDNGEIRTLIEGGTNARYSSTGHIVYARGQRLLAVPFDASSLEVTGTPVVILEPVSTFPINGPAQFALSPEGTLVYAPGPAWTSTGRVVLVSRRGEVEPLVETPRPIGAVRIAPGGGRLAIEIQGANHSIWTFDMARGALTPLLSGFNNFRPLWSPDGSRLAWSNDARGTFDVFLTSAGGSGTREQLTPVDGPEAYPESWSPDGRFLLYSTFTTETQRDLMVLPLGENRTPRVFLATDADEWNSRFSPDGEWVAHSSDESGRREIYLRSFRDPGPKWQVSTEGGTNPSWNPRGGELFYQIGDKMMAVDIRLNDTPEMGQPRLLFEKRTRSSGRPDYDVMPDGKRFIMIEDSEPRPRPTELVVVQNFAEELKRLAPKINR